MPAVLVAALSECLGVLFIANASCVGSHAVRLLFPRVESCSSVLRGVRVGATGAGQDTASAMCCCQLHADAAHRVAPRVSIVVVSPLQTS